MAQRIAIVGGGCAALWLALETSRAGWSTTVFTESPLAAYASTRNQGWLQSGALYAGLRQRQSAVDCWVGFSELLGYAPDAVRRHVPCFFLFDDDQGRDAFAAECHALNIPADPVSAAEAAAAVPTLAGTSLSPLRVLDCPMDSHKILSRLEADVRNAGATISVAAVQKCTVQRDGGAWRVLPQPRAAAQAPFDAVVLACGPYVVDLLASLAPALSSPFVATKIEVLAVQDVELAGMIVMPTMRPGYNLVPFESAAAHGFTMCITKDDTPIASATDHAPRVDRVKQAVAALHLHLPSLSAGLAGCPATVYACQKLSIAQRKLVDRSRIVEPLERHNSALAGLVVLYPGKFTSAHLAARDCLATLTGYPSRAVTAQPYAQPIANPTLHMKDDSSGPGLQLVP